MSHLILEPLHVVEVLEVLDRLVGDLEVPGDASVHGLQPLVVRVVLRSLLRPGTDGIENRLKLTGVFNLENNFVQIP